MGELRFLRLYDHQASGKLRLFYNWGRLGIWSGVDMCSVRFSHHLGKTFGVSRRGLLEIAFVKVN